jgi:hypothetical protein
MEEFGIVTKSGKGNEEKIDLSFNENSLLEHVSTINPPDHAFDDIYKSTASRIMQEKIPIFKLNVDVSNEILKGHEVVLSNKIVQRSFNLFILIMKSTKNTEMNNMNSAITYACRVASEEYITEWKDKQYLVLFILRMYIEKMEHLNKNELYMKIDTLVPIYVKNLMLTKTKKNIFSLHKLYKCCKI